MATTKRVTSVFGAAAKRQFGSEPEDARARKRGCSNDGKAVSRESVFGTAVVPNLDVEVEDDPRRLEQRQKQIDYGKNTIGYQRYVVEVPRRARGRSMPWTPDIKTKTSKRGFDSMMSRWRTALHKWEEDNPPASTDRGAKQPVSPATTATTLAAAAPAAPPAAGGGGLAADVDGGGATDFDALLNEALVENSEAKLAVDPLAVDDDELDFDALERDARALSAGWRGGGGGGGGDGDGEGEGDGEGVGQGEGEGGGGDGRADRPRCAALSTLTNVAPDAGAGGAGGSLRNRLNAHKPATASPAAPRDGMTAAASSRPSQQQARAPSSIFGVFDEGELVG